jgi:tetratricopeptide (TPR) repeat protein
VGVAALSVASSVATRAIGQGTTEPDYVQLYEQLQRDPANVELNRRYAEAAEQSGDLEAAIGALERILVIEPDAPSVRLQIGELYLRLGSTAAARTFLEPLIASGTTPEDVRTAALRDLRAAGGGPSPHHLSVTVFAGAQWQTNPAAAPGSPIFLLSGVPITVSNAAAKRSDSDVFAQANAAYSYDLASPFRDALVVDGTAYGSSYRRLHQLDTTLATVDAGPSLASERIGIAGGALRPYAIIGGARLGGAPYDETFGGGLSYGQSFGQNLPHLDLDYELRQANYHATGNYPTAQLLGGRQDHYAVGLNLPIGDLALVGLDGVYNRQNARFNGYSNDDYAVAATLSVGYGAALLPSGQPAVTTLSVARHYVAYDAPDPTVSAALKRGDRLWRISLGEIVPVTAALSIAAVIDRTINSSNVVNYTYNNTSFLLGPRLSF